MAFHPEGLKRVTKIPPTPVSSTARSGINTLLNDCLVRGCMQVFICVRHAVETWYVKFLHGLSLECASFEADKVD